MATPKTIIANDVALGKLTLAREGNALRVERRYVFVDETSTVIPNLTGGRVVEKIALIDVPANVLAALSTIDDWTYGKALQQEDMT